MAQLEISLYEKGTKLIAKYQPIATSLPIKASQIKTHVQNSDYANLYLLDDQVSLFADLVNEKIAQRTFDKPVEHPIAERRDANLSVHLSDSKMSAVLELTAPYGGNLPAVNAVIKFLQSKQIMMGVDKAAIENLLADAKDAEPGELFKAEVAKGQAAMNGRDAWFECLFPTADERALQPQENEQGKVDMRDLGKQISVSSGDPLVRRHPPKKGRAGFNVIGEAVAAVPGKLIEFETGKGTVLSETDQNLLIAARDGMPFLLKKGARVDDVMEIGSVDVSTGHVEFNGGVIVHGDVTEGMRLIAKGNVTVTGFIDNADVHVAGDLVVMQGIVGRKTESEQINRDAKFNCNLVVQGNVSAKYVQYASITAGGQVNFAAHLSHARVYARSIQGGDAKMPLGKIIGGLFEVDGFVACSTIGAPAAKSIHIRLAKQIENYQADLEKLVELKKQKRAILGEVEATWKHLKTLPESQERSTLIKKTIACYKKHDKDLKTARRAAEALREKIDHAGEGCYVKVRKALYNNVHFYLGELNYTTKEELAGGTLSVTDKKHFAFTPG
ncbi:DUF342 domain-containing protein [Gayadomonas joobiniege]|uniref:DUF342 domain-containing protein n=1 Tax=Gayadomonas joobiniege TaxID=1234606 RepID=UPI000363ACA1|nr:FapA family protein [Gayadomonas joobiniege]